MDLAVRPLGTITSSVRVPGLPSWPWMTVIAYCEQQQAVIEEITNCNSTRAARGLVTLKIKHVPSR